MEGKRTSLERLAQLQADRATQWAGEERFLRRYGVVFVLAGIILAMSAYRYGWYWITLQKELIRPSGWRALASPYLLVAVAVTAVPFVWLVVLKLQRRRFATAWRFPIAAIIAVVAMFIGDLALQTRGAQNALWLSVVARLRPGTLDYFIRELANIRLSVAAGEDMDRGPGYIFAGSSQMLRGVDFEALRRAWPTIPVKRRALAGMDPIKACAASSYLSIGPGDTLVMFVGELDIGANQSLPANWIRPLAGRRAIGDSWRSAGRSLHVDLWRTWIDLWSATMFETWRSRDYLNHVMSHAVGPATDTQQRSQEQVLQVQKETYQASVQDPIYHAFHYASIQRVAERMRSAGGRLVVVEGQVNPILWNPDTLELRDAIRARLSAMESAGLLDYVPETEQALQFEADDWADGTHLSERGRVKMTQFMIRYLAGPNG